MKNTQTVNITIPIGLLREVDALAKRDYTSRSDIIRQALLQRIRKPELNERGNPGGEWKTVIDFREVNPNGVPTEEVIAALRRLEEHDRPNRKALGPA